MPIASFSLTEMSRALEATGVSEGKCILLHSSLLHLGRLDGCPSRDMLGAIVKVLLNTLGTDGTLTALAPFWEYSNDGVPFDTHRSPVSLDIGVLSATIAAHPDAERSANPLFSLTGIGKLADYICNGPNASAFGAESAWDRAVKADARVVLFGSGLKLITLVRYIEQQVAVPYLFVKMFRTPILRNGVPLDYPVTALLRYHHLPLQYDVTKFCNRLLDAGVMCNAPLGGGLVYALDAVEAVKEGIDALQNDVHFFLATPPDYVDTELPLC